MKAAFLISDLGVVNLKRSNSKFESKVKLLDQASKSLINSTSCLEMSVDKTNQDSKSSTAVTSTAISPLMQAPPRINISSLLEKRTSQTFQVSGIEPIKVESFRPFTSVDKPIPSNFTALNTFDFKTNKRDTKGLEK